MAKTANVTEAKPEGMPPAAPSRRIERAACPEYKIMSRPGMGTGGGRIPLLSNHFKVVLGNPDAVFYQYSVSINTEDGKPVEGKGIGRKIIDKVCQTYSKELAGKKIAYDGEKCMFTVGSLPQTKCQFVVLLEGSAADRRNGSPVAEGDLGGNVSSKRSKRSYRSTTYKVEIAYASKIPLKAISHSLKGTNDDTNVQDALRVLDIVLRQQAANRGCLLVRQSFFHDDSRNFTHVGGGAIGVRGFHASFRPTQGGLSLNMDVSTTMILTPGPVIDFLLANQNVKEPRYIDWMKAKKILKNLRIKTRHRDREWKITGLSEKPCNQLFFSMKRRDASAGTEETVDITVYEYFVKHCGIELFDSAYFPCVDVGKPKRPNYIPLELCSLVSLQRYTKALSPLQRASLVEKSRQKPQERMQTLTHALKNYSYDEDPVLVECGTTIEKQLTQFEGRVLECPKLKVGQGSDCFPRNGRWNFNQKTLLEPVEFGRWVIANFSARCDTSRLSRDLIDCGRRKGLHIEGPLGLMEEDPSSRRCNPVTRVEKMLDKIRGKIDPAPKFILCLLPERKNSEIYGPWKKRCLVDFGVMTQCISPVKINDQYLTNVLLKINTKLGGKNSLLAIEHASSVPVIGDTPTFILGMDVSHGSPGQSDVPSIAAVVGSRCWPLISRYRACVRSQSPKVEMIDALYKPSEDGRDYGIIRELLLDFYNSSNGLKPTQIIVFRDGVSESQFNQVLNIEIPQIVQAYLHLGDGKPPKVTVIIAQKNHHTKLFLANASENVPPGTVVDTKIVHPRNYDFYMCAQAGMIGTSRPAHYNVLVDEIGFTPDELQNLVHSLSYVYQRSTTAISIVAPICYAHLAAAQVSQFIKFEDLSETSSGQRSSEAVLDLPPLHECLRSDMFFC